MSSFEYTQDGRAALKLNESSKTGLPGALKKAAAGQERSGSAVRSGQFQSTVQPQTPLRTKTLA